MVSKTTRTESIRKRKHRRAGKDRKAALANHGTTMSAADLFKVQDKAN